jgi:hypothetical protein
MRIDLHVHSMHSRRPSQWILKKTGCPESFTQPLRIYEIAMQRGMTHATITDHNSIGGALEIAHLPGVFISEEATGYFPDDGCKLHVLALDITESQHLEIQRLRKNIFELAAYFYQEKIFNIVAHPLYAVNDRLTADHFEQMLLLFRNFELNGARNSRENQTLKTIFNSGLLRSGLKRSSEAVDAAQRKTDHMFGQIFDPVLGGRALRRDPVDDRPGQHIVQALSDDAESAPQHRFLRGAGSQKV